MTESLRGLLAPAWVIALAIAGGIGGYLVLVIMRERRTNGRENGSGASIAAELELSRERHAAIMHGLERVVKSLEASIGVLGQLTTEIRGHAGEARPAIEATMETHARVKAIEPLVEGLYHGLVANLPRRRQADIG